MQGIDGEVIIFSIYPYYRVGVRDEETHKFLFIFSVSALISSCFVYSFVGYGDIILLAVRGHC
jgi:hypothetical protein